MPAPLSPSVAVILAAAGSGARIAAGGEDSTPKQWRPLDGRPLILHALAFFDALEEVGQIVLALDAGTMDDPGRLKTLAASCEKPVRFVRGGAHRQESVLRALEAVDPEPQIVLIHDAARPFPGLEATRRCIAAAWESGGAILARPVTETVKRVDAGLQVLETVPRRELWAAQTPQGFRYAELMEANRRAASLLERFTDDAGIFEASGGRVCVVPSDPTNLKVTHPEDFETARRILESRRA